MESVDVLVVGAGPAGSTAAYELARRGHRVTVVEEHPGVGKPVQCAGLVSDRVLELAGSRHMVQTPIHGATVYGPSMNSVSFRAPETRGYVIDRAGLDVHLADRAARAGAEYRTSVRFDGFAEAPPGPRHARLTQVGGAGFEVEARSVIGADGVSSAVARAARLRRRVEILPAFEAEFPRSPGDPDLVEVYLGNSFAPGLFGWWIPDGNGGARIGLAARPDGISAKQRFELMMRKLEPRFGAPLAPPVAYVVSGIPIGTLPRITADRVVLVGDAAAQVKPLSGGGIFTGMRAAVLAAEVVHGALTSDDLGEARLREYERRVEGVLGEEFRKAHYLRRLFARLTDEDFDRILVALQGAGMTESIVAFGDIDFPSNVAGKLLAQSPSLLRLFPKVLGAWLSSGADWAPALDEGPRRRSAT